MKRFEITWQHRAIVRCRNKDAAIKRFESMDFGKLDAKKNGIEEHRFLSLESFVCLDDANVTVSEDELGQEVKVDTLAETAGTVFAPDASGPIPLATLNQARALPPAARGLLITLEYHLVEEGNVFDTNYVRKLRKVFKESLGLYHVESAVTHGRYKVTLSADGWWLAWACRHLRAMALLESNPVPTSAQKRVGTAKRAPRKRTAKKPAAKKPAAKKATRKRTAKKPAAKKSTRKTATKKTARKRAARR